jgi:uncharacterized protein (DUF362 family)
MPRFAIERTGSGLGRAVEAVIDRAGLKARMGSSVFIKPNFTYPFFKEGVTTTRELIEEVVRILKDLGARRVVIGEGDGGYNSFSMDETFANYRLEELTSKYGVEVANTSRWPSVTWRIEARRGTFDVHLPAALFSEFDSFLTLPVPKVHAMTMISNAVKNQWGLVQDRMRLHFHVAFDEIITEINRKLPSPAAIVDGQYGLTRNGPMIEGIPLNLGWVSACDDLWLNDWMICRLMRVPVESVEHLVWARKVGLEPKLDQCEIDPAFDQFIDDRFYLKRNMWNYLAKSTWYSSRWNYFVYFGRLSAFLHKVMYSFRKKPAELAAKGVDWS